ncbi:MAG: amidohydrolase [Desulfobacterales bacterium]
MKHADILVTNGIVLTMNPDCTRIDKGAVAVIGNRIAAVDRADVFSDWTAAKVIDAKRGIIMPGLVNTHTHAAMTCFRGLADDLPLMNWLHDHIFPAEAKLNPDMVYSGSLLACAEMILSGTTCFCDMYLFEDKVAEAAKKAGMRAVVGEVLYDFPSPNYGPIDAGFRYAENMIRKWQNDPLVTVAIEPHSPYLCAPELLKTAAEMSRTHQIPLIVHVSETQSEVDQMQEKYGCSPVAHLANLHVLGPNLLACHCVALSDYDISLLQQTDTKVSHNPESNMKLASGIARVPDLLKAGVCVGLGTDGCSSNNNLDLFSEMDMAAKLHKVSTLDPTVMDARTVLEMCTSQGAKALGLGHICGSLEPGKHADIIVIDMNKPHLIPMYHPESHLVYSARGSDVVTSVIDGKVVMENRHLLTIDAEKVMADVRKIAETIRDR